MVDHEWINTLLLLGAAQGLFLAIVLATKKRNGPANRILAVAMVTFSIFIFEGVLYARSLHLQYPHFIAISKPLVFVFGPIFFLYAQAASQFQRKLPKGAFLHFIPFLLVTLYLIPFYAQTGPEKLAFLESLESEGPSFLQALIENAQYIHGLTYVGLTVWWIRRHGRKLKNTHSYEARINLRWLQYLTLGIVGVWGLVTALHVLDLVGLGLEALEAGLTAMAMSALVYSIGYLGLQQPEIFQPLYQDKLSNIQKISTDASNSATYKRSGLSTEEAAGYMQQLIGLMEKSHLYKQGLLTLQDLADELAISTHNLSEVINTQTGQNFYDFINGYRVEEVKRRLLDPQSHHLTVLAIAEESGFNSKSTFNTLFKKHTGQTPSQYRKQHLQ